MNTANKKLQSAMEYLMTYGWAILIIAVVIGVLYALGIFNGSGLLGSFCTAQTGYFCANPILSTNSPTLNVTIGQDTRLEWSAWKIFAVRGTAFNASSPNITGSGAFYNGEKQIVTIPLNSILGNYIPIGTPLSGSLWAEYCNTPNCNTPNQVSEIGIFYTKAAKLGYVTTSVSTTSLSTTSTSTTSTATTAPTTTIAPSGIIYSVPITLTNSQSSNTPSPFQQMVNISESAYSSYLTYNGNFANFEYYTLSGNTVNVLPAWIESNNSGKLTTWVKLPDGIPAKSNTIIYLGFASKSSNLLSSSGTTGMGEAPQLPCGSTPTSSCSTYAEYDDGASVFNFYDNFAKTSINSEWTQVTPSGTTISQNNGIIISTDSSATYGGLILTVGYTGIQIFEGDITAVSGVAAGLALQTGNSASSGGIDFNYWGGSVSTGTMSGGMVTNDNNNPNLKVSTGINGGAWLSSSSQVWYKNYVATTGSQTAYSLTSTVFPSIGIYYSSTSTSITYQWVRTRAYPPNGVMPSVTFGIVQGGSPSVTVSPSSVSLLPGTSFTLTADVSGGTSPYTYQWYNDTTGTGIPIAGATSSTYTAIAGSATGTFEYYVKVTDSESKTAQSLSSVVTVKNQITLALNTTGNYIFNVSAYYNISFNISGGSGGNTSVGYGGYGAFASGVFDFISVNNLTASNNPLKIHIGKAGAEGVGYVGAYGGDFSSIILNHTLIAIAGGGGGSGGNGGSGGGGVNGGNAGENGQSGESGGDACSTGGGGATQSGPGGGGIVWRTGCGYGNGGSGEIGGAPAGGNYGNGGGGGGGNGYFGGGSGGSGGFYSPGAGGGGGSSYINSLVQNPAYGSLTYPGNGVVIIKITQIGNSSNVYCFSREWC